MTESANKQLVTCVADLLHRHMRERFETARRIWDDDSPPLPEEEMHERIHAFTSLYQRKLEEILDEPTVKQSVGSFRVVVFFCNQRGELPSFEGQIAQEAGIDSDLHKWVFAPGREVIVYLENGAPALAVLNKTTTEMIWPECPQSRK